MKDRLVYDYKLSCELDDGERIKLEESGYNITEVIKKVRRQYPSVSMKTLHRHPLPLTKEVPIVKVTERTVSKLVIFCENYPCIYPTIYLAQQNYRTRPVTIVIPALSPDLIKFIRITNRSNFKGKLDIISFKNYYPKIFGIIPNILDIRDYERKIYERYFYDTKDCAVYFFSPHFNGVKVYLIKRLAKHNRLVYVDSSSLGSARRYRPKTPLGCLRLVIWKLTYAKEVCMMQLTNTGYRYFLSLPAQYIKRISSRVIDGEERDWLFEGALDMDEFRRKWWAGEQL